jgi:GDP-4-dehydro-6-deoxy-D-mannose reductase
MMRILITGSQGFAGRHLINELQKNNWQIGGFDKTPASRETHDIEYFQSDIRDNAAVEHAVKQFKPDACIHLSGIAFVPHGLKNVEEVLSVNTLGTICLLEACRQFVPAIRFLFVSSSEVYGPARDKKSVAEDDFLSPDNPYAVSKAAADYIVRFYARQYGMHTIVARPSNHIGPGQSTAFAVSSFAAQLAARPAPEIIKVGNLDSTRNFTDVRDVVRAYRLLIEKGEKGAAYNIAAGREVKLRYILEQLFEISGIKPKIEIDPERFRPDVPRPRLDTSKIRDEINWKPEIAMETTLRDIMSEAKVRN